MCARFIPQRADTADREGLRTGTCAAAGHEARRRAAIAHKRAAACRRLYPAKADDADRAAGAPCADAAVGDERAPASPCGPGPAEAACPNSRAAHGGVSAAARGFAYALHSGARAIQRTARRGFKRAAAAIADNTRKIRAYAPAAPKGRALGK